MTVSSGFFNSVNHDRKYNARQFASIYDGVINDGIFMSIGSKFAVTASSGLKVNVGTGRAWFDHSWILNDAVYPITLSSPSLTLDRIDAIVIETNWSETVRSNLITTVEGTPSSTPVKPTLTHTDEINQYPLAYVYVAAEATTITQANIENAIGTSATPYVTAILQTTNIDTLVAQWSAQWNEYMVAKQNEFDEWSEEQEEDFESWSTERKAAFNTWFAGIVDILDENVAAALYAAINEHTSDTTIHVTASDKTTWSGKANKTTTTSATMSASGWSNKEYSFEASYPVATYDLSIELNGDSATEEQIKAWSNARVIGSASYNKLYAKGDAPTIDIPIMIKAVVK